MVNEVFIVSAVRTPIGKIRGTLKPLKAHELGSIVISEVLKRANVKKNEVCEVILGQVLTAGQGQNTARQTPLNAGIPLNIPAININILCGSGLKAVVLEYQAILCGNSSIVVAGGQESMSNAPHFVNLRLNSTVGFVELKATVFHDELIDPYNKKHMGFTAETIARRHKISGSTQDKYALESQRRTLKAQNSGFFKDEIIPVTVRVRQRRIVVFDRDEHPKPNITLESLSTLKSLFKKNGSVTAVNTSGLSDGAAVVLLMNGEDCKKRGCTPMAKIVSFACSRVNPKRIGTASIYAMLKTVNQAGWTLDSVDLFELNDPFAAQSIAALHDLGLDTDRVNIYGGAISLGNPIGSSGARILVTLVHALLRHGKKRGIACLYVGRGMGIAVAIETV